jgi:hypothetical protein
MVDAERDDHASPRESAPSAPADDGNAQRLLQLAGKAAGPAEIPDVDALRRLDALLGTKDELAGD